MTPSVLCMPVGPLGANCYIVFLPERTDCLVIDPGGDGDKLLSACEGRTIAAVLLTHGHGDHIGGAAALHCPRLIVHALDAAMLADATANVSALFGFPVVCPPAAETAAEGDVIEAAGMTLSVLHTPGHTPGSVCYLLGDMLFTGDTMFKGGYGRTDLPGGSESALAASLRRLLSLPCTLRVYPGHGGATTIQTERKGMLL